MSLTKEMQDAQSIEPELLITESNFTFKTKFKIRKFANSQRQTAKTAKIAIPEITSFW